MLLNTLFLSTLAVAGLVSAQSKCKQNFKITGATGDVSALESCKTIEGDISIQEDVQTFLLPTSVTVIKGNLIADNAVTLATMNLQKLQEITGEFRLQSCRALSSLSAPSLTKVDSINWTHLTMLQSFQFTSKVTEASTVLISDTQLQNLGGLDLQTVTRLDIDNNRYLTNITMGLKNVSEILSISFNGQSVKTLAVSFPDLVWSNNFTLILADSLELPALKYLNGSMNIANTTIEEISCPKLQIVQQTLAFIGNPQLSKLEFPVLEEIDGGFKVHNNTKLQTIDGFPKLKQVKGAIDFVGKMKKVTLPSLSDVRGGFNLQTTETLDCQEFQDDKDKGVIQGDDYTCKSREQNPTTIDGTPGTDGSGSGGSSNSTGNGGKSDAAGHPAVSLLLVLSIAAVAFVF